jgi:LPS O-antigen subunit length determinant protein (WzzB/FepE family)
MEQIKNNINHEDEIDLRDLLKTIWRKKLLISFITSLAAIFSVLYSLYLPNIYTSRALLAPTDETQSLTSKLGSFSAIAGIAGVSLPSGSANKSQEAIQRILSLDFFSNHFLPYIELEDLMAIESWSAQDNILYYNKKIFNKATNEWVKDAKSKKEAKPSNQEAYKVYRKILFVNENKKTSYVSISINHQSPIKAKEWVDIIIQNINESMREHDKKVSMNAINFLNESSTNTRLSKLKETIAQLTESQMQTLMMASISESYIFKTIESPVVAEEKTSPSRAIICILGTILGAIVGLLLAIIAHFKKKDLII